MKYLFFLFILLLLSINLFSQEQFNKTYGYFDQAVLRNIIAQDTRYISVGGAYTYTDIIINIYSLIGDTTITKEYGNDTTGWFHGAENSLQETETGNYILGGQRAISWYRDNLLIKFDNNFDTIFTKTYYPVDDNGYKDVATYGSCVGKDTSYFLIGTTNIDNNYDSLYQYQMQLIKTDTLGNLLWRKTYGNDTVKHYGYKVVNTFDGGYLLGGWAYTPATNNGDWAIVKVDENGENPIYKYFGNPNYDEGRVMGITPTKDSCYLITGAYAVGYYAGYTTVRARILKLDKDLNTVWDKLYLKPTSTSFFYEAIEKENGKLFTYGAERNSLNYKMSVIMELTASGDSIWKQITTGYDTLNGDNNLESCKLTPDGGMIFGGYTYNSASLSPAQQMWLVKTDSMGCDGTEWTCDISYLEEVASKEGSGLRVYPNPVKESLTLALSNREGTGAVQNTNSIAQTTKFKRSPLAKGVRGIDNSLTKLEFEKLPINQKIKYNIAHPEQNFWGKKEEQEMQELSRKLAYAFPFEVIKGKVDIFAIDPSLSAQVESRKLKVKSNSTKLKSERSLLAKRDREIDVTIYDIYGKVVKQLKIQNLEFKIQVADLEKGIYFIKVDEQVAKFVKE